MHTRAAASASTRRRPRAWLGVLFVVASCGGTGRDSGVNGPPVPPAPTGRPILPAAYRASGLGAAGHTFVHLFEWPWPAIATECEQVLGPAGWRAVQVSPPQEHVIVAGRPWWERYQPVSHSIAQSRSGTGAQFADMVARCRTAGVEIYVDAVINHMTAGSGTGTAGTSYTKYEYPPLFSAADFHPSCGVSDYRSASNVQDCELLGLADLRTRDTTVQRKLAQYLVSLARLGVAGFRIDAAKHMQPTELDAIVARVHTTLAAESRAAPYWFAEVIDPGNEGVRAFDYFGLGFSSGGAADITEFRFRGVGERLLSANGTSPAELAQFSPAAWQLMPSDKAVVFLENHDTQRGGGISYRDGGLFTLANVWLLAQPYGYPKVLSGYGFDRGTPAGRDAGPPPGATVSCVEHFASARIGEWTCEHRDPAIAAMVRFRRAVAGAPIERAWDNGTSALAFSRGTLGFVAINAGASALSATVPSALAAGSYCDVLSGGGDNDSCVGQTITVAANGMIAVQLDPYSAIAILTGAAR